LAQWEPMLNTQAFFFVWVVIEFILCSKKTFFLVLDYARN
jgi:hypothetical protein